MRRELCSVIMLNRKLLFAGLTAYVLLLFSLTCTAQQSHICSASSCGNIPNISYPFRLKSDPQNCGHPNYELACENNRTILSLPNFGKFYVEAITYENYSIRVVDPGLDKDNCSSFPLHSLYPYYLFEVGTAYEWFYGYNRAIIFISCLTPPVNSTLYIDTAFCSKNTSSNSILSTLRNHSYVVLEDYFTLSDLEDSCIIGITTWASGAGLGEYYKTIGSNSFSDIHDRLVYGFELSWYRAHCGDCEARSGDCYLDFNNKIACDITCNLPNSKLSSIRRLRGLLCGIRQTWLDVANYIWRRPCRYGLHIRGTLFYAPKVLCGTTPYFGVMIMILTGLFLAAFLTPRLLCGIPFLLAFSIYKLRRRHLSIYDTIEDFLQNQNNLVPIRYDFSDIKKMTNGFKEKLGEGGYGTVYKGKLRSGFLVAVKIMGKSKATGQEFINEVGTIGRIHHVNVVQLIGFCAEGSKRALVYDFMPNGSLEKYIFPQEEENDLHLSCEKMYEISLGVARGIQYLHRGCDMQILHFDIKPHNILLDQNFTPKVSDFGLAKLYPTDDSIVSMTAARGTMGYMAPELFYKNIGGVSYKADVYSFGMLLMEMAGRRKNLNAYADHFSQIYFPSWVYDQFNEGKDIDLGDATEEERKTVKKMIIVALWCIQMKPTNRPSMNEVIDMLERNVEQLQMPPKPFLTPQEKTTEDHGINNSPV